MSDNDQTPSTPSKAVGELNRDREIELAMRGTSIGTTAWDIQYLCDYIGSTLGSNSTVEIPAAVAGALRELFRTHLGIVYDRGREIERLNLQVEQQRGQIEAKLLLVQGLRSQVESLEAKLEDAERLRGIAQNRVDMAESMASLVPPYRVLMSDLAHAMGEQIASTDPRDARVLVSAAHHLKERYGPVTHELLTQLHEGIGRALELQGPMPPITNLTIQDLINRVQWRNRQLRERDEQCMALEGEIEALKRAGAALEREANPKMEGVPRPAPIEPWGLVLDEEITTDFPPPLSEEERRQFQEFVTTEAADEGWGLAEDLIGDTTPTYEHQVFGWITDEEFRAKLVEFGKDGWGIVSHHMDLSDLADRCHYVVFGRAHYGDAS